jgi:hypothetical protein
MRTFRRRLPFLRTERNEDDGKLGRSRVDGPRDVEDDADPRRVVVGPRPVQ